MNPAAFLQGWMPHLIVVPILLPMVTAALMLLFRERSRTKSLFNVVSVTLGLLVSIALVGWVHAHDTAGAIGVYLPANWDVPFGIALVVDRLSALMLLVTSIVAVASMLYSLARWHRAGVYFHTLFQLQLMGLNGAFLTADLFNLFVFFEVMLAASYGLLLHGSGAVRVRAGLHYIAVNLLASSLFLIGAAMIYGVTGTLSMADVAQKIPLIPEGDRGLLHAGAGILAIAFLTKAAMWPLNFWLVPAYSAAGAPIAALFAILSKVGIYAVLRTWTLFFGEGSGASAAFGADALLWGGLATIGFGSIGVLATHHPGRLAGFSVIVSSGTLLTAIGFARPALTGATLYYLISSVLALAALFLIVELIDRAREVEPAVPSDEADPLPFSVDYIERDDSNLDEDEIALIGEVIPAALAFLGLSFVASVLVVAGLPPFPGFLGKFAMLSSVLGPIGGSAQAGDAIVPFAGWVFIAVLIGSGLLSLIAMSRAGIRYFWAPQGRSTPRLRIIECLPIAALLIACTVLTVRAESVMRYTLATADALHSSVSYVDAVMTTRPVPSP